MALSIKTVEADRLARELAAAAHETITEAVTTALRERLERIRSRPRVDIQHRLDRLVLEYSGHPVHDDRSPEEILGYDDAGLPT
jgi:antitoxin VapB